jgi:quercetin dioxygenase-like cupin family protein
MRTRSLSPAGRATSLLAVASVAAAQATITTLMASGDSPVLVPVPQQSGITRDELQRHDLSTPGREVVQVRIAFDPGAAFGRHRHPGEEIIYVISGLLEYQVEGQPPSRLKAGDVLFIPAGVIHSARNVGREIGAELATYVVIKGKPILEMVK